ncbi:hypothetical protein BC826DRAFT_317195 [Russula brevipes]|nr:hypothetical protein BC826DRAFT_317195 [Russula brevipes]
MAPMSSTFFVKMQRKLRLCMDTTWISDRRPVMLKRQVKRRELTKPQINRLFSTDPLWVNPRNRCVQLLDTSELPNDRPIMVHALLRPFYKPPLHTFGEFVTFFAKICEARLSYSCWGPITSHSTRAHNSCMKIMLPISGLYN